MNASEEYPDMKLFKMKFKGPTHGLALVPHRGRTIAHQQTRKRMNDLYGSDVFARSNLTKEHNGDEDDVVIDDRENFMNQLISMGVECASSSLINDAINKKCIIKYEIHA